VNVDIISQYPEFSRKQVDLDDDIKQQIPNYAFPAGHSCEISNQEPESRKMSVRFFGGDSRIYM
jgi:hypothetical protein